VIPPFAVTWDYRCPFAFNAHDHVVEALEAGADWQVTFIPFSLGQVHVGDGEVDIWDRPDDDSGLLALQAGTVVRDLAPDHFLRVHRELFRVRHVHAKKLKDPAVVREVLDRVGVDTDAVFEAIADGSALATVRKEHEAAVAEHRVWGVPTFVVGDQASFVRLMHPSTGDADESRRVVERIIELLGWPELNEFKHTSVPR
jgi:2-hydroxychromene-2-carboxylate isomerase